MYRLCTVPYRYAACKKMWFCQSPVIIQFQCDVLHTEPPDGYHIFICDLYNSVLGYGKVQGVSIVMPIPDKPGKFRSTLRDMFTFPA